MGVQQRLAAAEHHALAPPGARHSGSQRCDVGGAQLRSVVARQMSHIRQRQLQRLCG